MNVVVNNLAVCTLYIPENIQHKNDVKCKTERLSRLLKRLGLELRLVVDPAITKLALVTPFGVFEDEEIDILIRQLEG